MEILINDATGILTVLCGIPAAFFLLEKRTKWKIFNFFPPLLFIYCIPAILSNLPIDVFQCFFKFQLPDAAVFSEGSFILPRSSSVYTMLKEIVLPLFLVIMLLKVDIASTVKVMGRGVFVMLMGTAGVVIGAPLAYLLVRNRLDPETWKAFGTLAGSWIGGTGNMGAVSESLGVGEKSHLFGLAVLGDNLVYIIWLPIMLSSKSIAKQFHRFVKIDHHNLEVLESIKLANNDKPEPLAMRHFLYLFVIGFGCIWIASSISAIIPVKPPEENPILTATTWKILIITTLGLILSCTPARKIPASHELGTALVYIFVANMGARADLSQLDGSAGWFILACFVWIFIHGAFCLLGAYLLKVDIHSTAIASAANIGGVASAPIVAAHHNDKLVPVSILMALIGYAVGTYGALLAAKLCQIISIQV